MSTPIAICIEFNCLCSGRLPVRLFEQATMGKWEWEEVDQQAQFSMHSGKPIPGFFCPLCDELAESRPIGAEFKGIHPSLASTFAAMREAAFRCATLQHQTAQFGGNDPDFGSTLNAPAEASPPGVPRDGKASTAPHGATQEPEAMPRGNGGGLEPTDWCTEEDSSYTTPITRVPWTWT